MIGRKSTRTGEARITRVTEEISKREGKVFLVLIELCLESAQNFRFGIGSRKSGSYIAQRLHATFANDALRFFCHDAEHTRDAAIIVGQGAVGERVIGLFRKATALKKKKECLVIGGLAAAQHALNARANIGPDFRPNFTGARTESPGMLQTESWSIGIVIKHREFVAPSHPHRVTRREQYVDDGAQTLRPEADRSQRSG